MTVWSKWKIQQKYIFIQPLGPFSLKNDALPLNSFFDLQPLQYTDLTQEIWRFLVCVFLEKNYLRCNNRNALQYYFTVKIKIKINLIASSCFRSRILRTKELLTSGLSRELLTSGLSRPEPYNLETVFILINLQKPF